MIARDVYCFLVGEALMRQPSPGRLCQSLIANAFLFLCSLMIYSLTRSSNDDIFAVHSIAPLEPAPDLLAAPFIGFTSALAPVRVLISCSTFMHPPVVCQLNDRLIFFASFSASFSTFFAA